jgi:glycosyltransferase involved in cell wall biosynthesis
MLAQMPDFDMWIRLCSQYEIHIMEERLIKFRIMDGEMNTSGNRLVNHIRSANEYYKLLQMYRTLLKKDDIFKTFPDFTSYDRGEDTDAEYVLARVCLETEDFFLRQLLAIEILFDVLNNPARRQHIEQVYNFSYKDFIVLTGQCDIFFREEIQELVNERDEIIAVIAEYKKQTKNLAQIIGDRNKQVQNLSHIIVERNKHIKNINQMTANLNQSMVNLNQIIVERDKQIGHIHAEYESYVQLIENSLSWKITRPLRYVLSSYRRAIKLIWWTVTLQLSAQLQAEQLLAQSLKNTEDAEDIEITNDNQYCLAVPFNYLIEKPMVTPKVAVIFYLQCPEILEEFKHYLINIPFCFDLFITTDSEQKKNDIIDDLSEWNKGSVDIRVVADDSGDVAAKLVACRDVYENYEFFLHIHAEKSPYSAELTDWQEYLLKTLLGSERIVASIFEAFSSNPMLGMVASEHFKLLDKQGVELGENVYLPENFSKQLDIQLIANDKIDFPSGAMFWGRSSTLKPLLDMCLTMDDFSSDFNSTSLSHIIKNLYFFVCERANYQWIKIVCSATLQDEDNIIWVESKELLVDAIEYVQRRFLTKNLIPSVSKEHFFSPHIVDGKPSNWRILHAKSTLHDLLFAQFCQELEKHIAKQESLIDFDEDFYLATNPDVAEEVTKGTVSCGYVHYCLAGQYEGRVYKDPRFEDECLQNAIPLHLLRSRIEEGGILKPTILFDHNGGGGSNAYTQQLIKDIHTKGCVALRVYCFNGIWFVLWSADEDKKPFFSFSIDELFEVLALLHSERIVINSLYGYPDIKVAIDHIIQLTQKWNATLDFKVHDFYALCPSPHLVDFDEKYCGVPKDAETCKLCLEKNTDWYHSWYPRENRPTAISVWREPFAKLFAVSSTVTFFDSSSVDIMRKAFHLEDLQISIVPHVIDHIQCDTPIDLSGALHIGVLGVMSHIKGGHVVNALCKYINKKNLGVPTTVVGLSHMETYFTLNVTGEYKRDDLPLIIAKQGINVILMPSVVPETFSYTISEAMMMGLPIVAFDIGAQGSRVKNYILGKVVPVGSSPAVILAAIQSVLKAAQE